MIEFPAMYRVPKDTTVLVVNEKFAMQKHVMKNDRDFRTDNRITNINVGHPGFTGVDTTQRWTLVELDRLQMWVFVTGHSKWPYIIIERNHLHNVAPFKAS